MLCFILCIPVDRGLFHPSDGLRSVMPIFRFEESLPGLPDGHEPIIVGRGARWRLPMLGRNVGLSSSRSLLRDRS